MKRLLVLAIAACTIALGCSGDDEGGGGQAQGGSDDPSTVETSTGTGGGDTATEPAPEPPAEGEVLIDVGTSADLYAKFPAPPEDVTEVSFQLPTFQSIDRVQISE